MSQGESGDSSEDDVIGPGDKVFCIHPCSIELECNFNHNINLGDTFIVEAIMPCGPSGGFCTNHNGYTCDGLRFKGIGCRQTPYCSWACARCFSKKKKEREIDKLMDPQAWLTKQYTFEEPKRVSTPTPTKQLVKEDA